jgi:hypothetical protein
MRHLKPPIARAKDPSLSPDERHKAGLDVALQMMGHPCFHDIDAALAVTSEMPPEEAAENKKSRNGSHRRERARYALRYALYDWRVRGHHGGLRRILGAAPGRL